MSENPAQRWLVATGVTVIAFAVPTVVCGLWALPPLIQDAGARWAVASSLGLALVALAALWGYGYASSRTTATPDTAGTVEARGPRSVAGRRVKGNINTGDRGVPATSPAAHGQAPTTPPAPTPPGSVVASGERSVATGDEVEGDINTGDQLNGGPAP